MGIAEFLILFYSNIYLSCGCIIASIIIYYFIYRRYWISLLDPFSYMLLGSCMGLAVVLTLWLTKSIRPLYVYSYLLTQICFYIGFVKGHKSGILSYSKKIIIINYKLYLLCFFFTVTSIDIVCQLMQYKLLGIPLFQKSRLDIMANAGGAGILQRFIEVSRMIGLFLSFYYIQKENSTRPLRIITISYLFAVCGFCILSGARSSFLSIATAFFFFSFVYAIEKPTLFHKLRTNELKILLFLFFSVIFINYLRNGALNTAIIDLGVRLMAYGDVYFYAYPNDVIMSIDDSRPFESIFSSILGFFRIIPYSDLPKPIGQDLFDYFSTSGDIGGPNARHNIVSFLYFGFWGGALFSYLLGYLTGLFRVQFLNARRRSILTASIIAVFYAASCGIETDVNYFIFKINSIIITIPIFIIVSSVLYVMIKCGQIAHRKVLF